MKLRFIAATCVLLCLSALALIILSPSPVIGDDGTPPPLAPQGGDLITKGPWIIYSDDPGRMDIMIETLDSVPDINFFIVAPPPPYPVTRSYHEWGWAGRRLWRATVTGLEHNTWFPYSIVISDEDDNWVQVDGSFTTPPGGWVKPTLNFFAYGDTRSTTDSLDQLKNIAEELSMSRSDQYDADFVIHTGDFVFEGGRVPFKQYLVGPVTDNWNYALLGLDEMVQFTSKLPIFTTIGNHDFSCGDDCNKWYEPFFSYCDDDCESGYVYLRHFPYDNYDGRVDPDGPIIQADLDKFYYSFDWGPAHFFSLNTYPMDSYCAHSYPMDADSGKLKWLETELKAVEHDKRPWKIVFFHAPPYDADCSCNQAQIRDNLIPLLERYGVDLVMSGHEHYYARKKVNGIQYLVLGGGGASLSPIGCTGGVDFARKDYHYAFFEISEDYMNI